uniref:Hypoxia inducible factor 1, alpha subunit n=1 Tax=Ascaris suum TaxID=6253 RepID=E0D3G8_ASCSU|nr:hypoxia inducible factor 1, alpha subunit [Ascaris suum]
MMADHGGDFEADCSRKRNLDRRRETSRYAARDRRGKEADIFTDLKEVVPIVEEATVTHVDRIALLRVASTMFRLRKHASKLLKTALCEESLGLWSEATLLESLDGFMAIIDSDGVILYITESVSIYLGLTQTDLTGRSLKEFVHPNDYEEVSKSSAETSDDGYMTVMRMKSVISPRGRNLNLKSALFKPVNCRIRAVTDEGGRLRVLQCSAQPAGQGSSAAMAAKSAEIPNGTYMTRHTCDMKFSYVSESFNYILRHEARSLMGTSFYSLVHPADINAVAASMREMLSKGHTRTPYYRLIGAGRTVVWVQTEATTVNHTSKGHKGQYVICVHELLGTQNELESFMVGRDSCLTSGSSVQVKKELDDSPDSRKSSYDEVLQWLFRDHPNSPAPNAALFRPQDCHPKRNRLTGANSDDPDPPLATAALFASRLDSPVSSVDDITYDNSPTSPYTNNAGLEYSPLAAGVAECELRSSSDSHSSAGGRAGGIGITNCGGSGRGGRVLASRGADSNECIPRTSRLHEFTTDLPSDPFLNTIRLPTIPSTDAYALSTADAISDGASERSHLYSSLSTPCAQYSSSVGYDPYMSASSTVAQPTQTHCGTAQVSTTTAMAYKDSHEEFFENPDLQTLAPFVAHEDMMQLTTDIHSLLPDFNFADWIPADPAPLHRTNSEQQRSCATSGGSPALSPPASNPANTPQSSLSGCMSSPTTPGASSAPTSRHNSRATNFGTLPYPTPSTSPGSKSATASHYSFSNVATATDTTMSKRTVAATLVSRSQSETLSRDNNAWVHQQQHHPTPSVHTTVLGGGCTWTEIGTRTGGDPVLAFRRDTSAA